MEDEAFVKDQWLDLMDTLDAFAVSAKKQKRPDYFLMTFSDGFCLFDVEQWDKAMEAWRCTSGLWEWED
jgi:hypothetical protein